MINPFRDPYTTWTDDAGVVWGQRSDHHGRLMGRPVKVNDPHFVHLRRSGEELAADPLYAGATYVAFATVGAIAGMVIGVPLAGLLG